MYVEYEKKTKCLLTTPYTIAILAGLVPSFNIKAMLFVALFTIITYYTEASDAI